MPQQGDSGTGGVPGVAGDRDVLADALLSRIREGDREAAAEFVLRFGPVLRQRLRARLGPGLRRLMDSADLISSVARRLDEAVAERRASFDTRAQLLAFVNRLASVVIADQARVLARLRRAEQEETRWAQAMVDRVERGSTAGSDAFENTIETAFSALETDRERRVLSLWLLGMSHAEIAFELGLSSDAVRQQWHRLREKLVVAFSDDGTIAPC